MSNTFQYIVDKYGVVDGASNPIVVKCVRDDFPQLFKELGYTIGAEIGVLKGEFSEKLCLGNPDLKLFSIDLWKAYGGYDELTVQNHLDQLYKKAVSRLGKYDNCKILRKFSSAVSLDFKDGWLDFVYIDANHTYKACMDDLSAWVPKVRFGGIVAGHDYGKIHNDESNKVSEAVNEYVSRYKIKNLMITNEAAASFLWINQ